MTKLLENKTALVTGCGGGLGAVICQALAVDGARIVAQKIKEIIENNKT